MSEYNREPLRASLSHHSSVEYLFGRKCKRYLSLLIPSVIFDIKKGDNDDPQKSHYSEIIRYEARKYIGARQDEDERN